MTLYAVVEPTVLAATLVVSLWIVAGRWMPRIRARMQAACVRWLSRASHPTWVRRAALRWQPTVATACGDGCTQCGQCGPTEAAPAVRDRPVVWMSRRS